jgi:hypothetical protein
LTKAMRENDEHADDHGDSQHTARRRSKVTRRCCRATGSNCCLSRSSIIGCLSIFEMDDLAERMVSA